MLERLFSFFKNIFGLTPAPPLVEDASDLGDLNLSHTPEDTSNPNQRTRGLGSSSRSLTGEEESTVLDVSGNEGITISQPRFLWCLDNGHGSLQKGKRSPFFNDNTQFEEWEFNRDVVQRIATRLDEAGVQYFVVVPEDNVGSFLRERVQRANEKESPLGLPKIYLSIHANALGSNEWDNRARGVEVWHFPGSNSGQKLSSEFQRAILKYLP
ncbi:MAG: N-acetylmuramoyl-L-alanine amidase, partial [Bacteroidota bacterium]